ncbi:MAG: hypothetical protein M1831_002177 [Alyxoria varia]|nr:MAG: hypothetical protein M1831_002177 [Alyxoria varia]
MPDTVVEVGESGHGRDRPQNIDIEAQNEATGEHEQLAIQPHEQNFRLQNERTSYNQQLSDEAFLISTAEETSPLLSSSRKSEDTENMSLPLPPDYHNHDDGYSNPSGDGETAARRPHGKRKRFSIRLWRSNWVRGFLTASFLLATFFIAIGIKESLARADQTSYSHLLNSHDGLDNPATELLMKVIQAHYPGAKLTDLTEREREKVLHSGPDDSLFDLLELWKSKVSKNKPHSDGKERACKHEEDIVIVHQDTSSFRRVLVVGDVHGRLDALDTLLAGVDFDHSQDLLVLTGDLVAKDSSHRHQAAKASEEVLEFVRKHWQKSVVSVRGNHEGNVLQDAGRGGLEPEEWCRARLEDQKNYYAQKRQEGKGIHSRYLDLIEEFPHILRLDEYPVPSLPPQLDRKRFSDLDPEKSFQSEQINHSKRHQPTTKAEHVVVHAGILPTLPLQDQNPFDVTNMRAISVKKQKVKNPNKKHHHDGGHDGKPAENMKASADRHVHGGQPWFDVWEAAMERRTLPFISLLMKRLGLLSSLEDSRELYARLKEQASSQLAEEIGNKPHRTADEIVPKLLTMSEGDLYELLSQPRVQHEPGKEPPPHIGDASSSERNVFSGGSGSTPSHHVNDEDALDLWQKYMSAVHKDRELEDVTGKDLEDVDAAARQLLLENDEIWSEVSQLFIGAETDAEDARATRDGMTKPMRVLYGHDAKTGFRSSKWSVGLDGDCARGGKLVGLLMENPAYVSRPMDAEQDSSAMDSNDDEQAQDTLQALMDLHDLTLGSNRHGWFGKMDEVDREIGIRPVTTLDNDDEEVLVTNGGWVQAPADDSVGANREKPWRQKVVAVGCKRQKKKDFGVF